jgi:CRP-like cAMP-binding protein
MIVLTTTPTLQSFVEKQLHTTKSLPFETEIKTFEKNTILTSPGDVEQNLYFIKSGIIQMSIKTNDKEERIIYIVFQNQFASALSSFIRQKPSKYTVTCLTKCELEIVTHENLFNALEKSLIANKIYRYFLETACLYSFRKHRDLMTKDATTRYLDLVKREPNISKLLSIDKIAKYLGIHPRSLSRIRKT